MRRLLTLALVLLAALAAARADDRPDLEKELRQEYKDKVVILRHFYSGGNLRFDASGKKLKGGSAISWTTDAEIRITELRLKGNTIEIKGRRLLLLYDRGNRFQDFGPQDPHPVKITLELPSSTPTEDSIHEVWKNVFFQPGENLADAMPPYWRGFFRTLEGKAPPAPPAGQSGQPQIVKAEPGVVSPPQIIFQPDPEYSEVARGLKVQGTVVLFLVVDADGRPRDIQVARPCGLGLDEKAIEAVSRWKFKPAMKGGQPVAVAINIEVNFHLF